MPLYVARSVVTELWRHRARRGGSRWNIVWRAFKLVSGRTVDAHDLSKPPGLLSGQDEIKVCRMVH